MESKAGSCSQCWRKESDTSQQLLQENKDSFFILYVSVLPMLHMRNIKVVTVTSLVSINSLILINTFILVKICQNSNFCWVFRIRLWENNGNKIRLLFSCFLKVYFVQDINAGLKDVAEIPEKQVSTLTHSKACSLRNMLQFMIWLKN